VKTAFMGKLGLEFFINAYYNVQRFILIRFLEGFMDRTKRNERISAMVKILSDAPNRSFTLSYFSDLFGAAKSTISEDVDIAQGILERFSLGSLETTSGSAGGVKYLATTDADTSQRFISEMCIRLSDPDRILPGGYLYIYDILSNPSMVTRMGRIMAMWFYRTRPDFVVTVETKGIPVALMAAQCLNVPLIFARRDARISDGSMVTINYVTGSGRNIQTMSLPKRSIREGQRALIIDDFMKGGGTLRGMVDMMAEFQAEVVGVGVVIGTAQPEKKRVAGAKSLMVLTEVDAQMGRVVVEPSELYR